MRFAGRVMDPPLPMPSEIATKAPSSPVTVVTGAVTVATSTVVTAATRSQRVNGPHRAINVHGLMYNDTVINDMWVNAILSTLALSCAACVCLCFLYCKIQQWKHDAEQRRRAKISRSHDEESLPSYTIVTGLPSYDEALERMRNNSPGSPQAHSSANTTAAAAGLWTIQTTYTSKATNTPISMVHLMDETADQKPPSLPPSLPPSPPLPRFKVQPTYPVIQRQAATLTSPRLGLVSHNYYTHNGTCSHCLSVQELLETYNVR
ncbi:uncharacterized protein LOC126836573 [Adelges cooleyi]|uniref:uncharacterized protein LOC126836573 n=1 Tax=Adelges cooleyi TaxID=133065 RepID=UPI00217FAF25|nr:uncharacterized protein LOC126836573 [Adelges cooleyi]